jgi:acyl-CoA thioesterase
MSVETDRQVAARPDAEFDREIELTSADSGGYAGEFGRGWLIGDGVNGGLLLASVGQALRHAFTPHGHPDPISISAYYLTASKPGPVTMHTEEVRRGRGLSTGTVSMRQADENGSDVERLRAIATYGDLASLPDDVHTTATPPDMPPPEACIGTDQAPPDFLSQASLLERFDLRLDPATVGWAVGEPSRRGVIRGWLRLADGREPDPLMLLLAVDALPPVTFDLGLFGWTPTLELTAHVRAEPAPGWLQVVHSTRNFAGGMLEEDAEVWDSTGRLVAQSRQLARAPRPQP